VAGLLRTWHDLSFEGLEEIQQMTSKRLLAHVAFHFLDHLASCFLLLLGVILLTVTLP
jgi:hypothetical protein